LSVFISSFDSYARQLRGTYAALDDRSRVSAAQNS
jgi:hypothetical protein